MAAFAVAAVVVVATMVDDQHHPHYHCQHSFGCRTIADLNGTVAVDCYDCSRRDCHPDNSCDLDFVRHSCCVVVADSDSMLDSHYCHGFDCAKGVARGRGSCLDDRHYDNAPHCVRCVPMTVHLDVGRWRLHYLGHCHYLGRYYLCYCYYLS